MKIAVETLVRGTPNKAWDTWNNPADIKQWNAAHEDWHTTSASVDLREGGKFLSRMEAKAGRPSWTILPDTSRRKAEQEPVVMDSKARAIELRIARGVILP